MKIPISFFFVYGFKNWWIKLENVYKKKKKSPKMQEGFSNMEQPIKAQFDYPCMKPEKHRMKL